MSVFFLWMSYVSRYVSFHAHKEVCIDLTFTHTSGIGHLVLGEPFCWTEPQDEPGFVEQ